MSAALKNALKTLLLTLSQFTDVSHPELQEAVVLADPRVLDRGFDHCIIIWSGPLDSGDAAGYTITHNTSIRFQAFVRFADDASADAALQTFTDDIVELLDTHPTLNGQPDITLERLSADDPFYVRDTAQQGPFFLMREFTLEISERVALSGGEY